MHKIRCILIFYEQNGSNKGHLFGILRLNDIFIYTAEAAPQADPELGLLSV